MFNKRLFDQNLPLFYEAIKKRPEIIDPLYIETQSNFQTYWNIESLDFQTMYASSFQSDISKRLWKGIDFFPVEMMIKLINKEKEYMRSVFRDLFNESISIDGRIQRFSFHCDQILGEVRGPSRKISSHYHDENFIAQLLSFRFPNAYAPLDKDGFLKMMTTLGARNLGTNITVEQYFKNMKLVAKFIHRDPNLSDLILNISKSEGQPMTTENILPAFYFLQWIVEQ